MSGGQEVLSRIKPPYIMAEIWDEGLRIIGGTSGAAFLRRMDALGYDAHRDSFEVPHILLTEFSQFFQPNPLNFFFVRRMS